jgi:hypothetical protein
MHNRDAYATATAQRLLALLRGDDLDAAIEAGLMAFDGFDALPPDERAVIASAQQRLRDAWAARDRYRAREARLARRAAERQAKRVPPRDDSGKPPPLPPAAAAALARAKAKAAGKA